MKILHRVGYYLGGFSIGLIVLAFFLNGKKVSCDYGPEARVLKNINSKKFEIPANIKTKLITKNIDSINLRELVKSGTIIFSKSNTRKEPCGWYYIESNLNEIQVDLKIENCEKIATIKEVYWN